MRADKDAQNSLRKFTLADLQAGLKKAEDLVRAGRNVEALALYRELYAMGRIGNTTLSRNLVLQKLSKIAVTYPAARQVLVDLRDSGIHELQSGSTDRRVTGDVVLINRELRDNSSTIALYNSLPPDDTRRQAVATIGIDAFIESRQYDAIVEARPFGHMLTELDAGMARAGNANSNIAGHVISSALANIEALVATNRIQDAKILIDRLERFDPSVATKRAVQQHVERASANRP